MLGRNTTKFAVGELGSRVPLLLLEITLARLLGPVNYGIWSIIQTIATYGNFLHFGVAPSLARHEPRLIAETKYGEVSANRAAAYGFQILVVMVLAASIILSSFFDLNLFNSIGGSTSAISILAVILLQQLTITTQASVLNEYKFMVSSVARLVYAFTFLALGLTAAHFESPIFWLTISWTISLIASLALIRFTAQGILVYPTIDFARTLSMLSDGFPIMLQGLLRFGLMSVDKLAVFVIGRPEEIGYYGIGSLGAGITGLFGSMVARVSLPTILRLNIEPKSKDLMQAEFNRVYHLIQSLTFGATFVICSAAPILIHYGLPAYEPAMKLIGILAIAGAFTGQAQALNDITMALGVKLAVLINSILMLAIEILLMALIWSTTEHIEAIALCVLLVMVLMNGRALWLTMRAMGFNGTAMVKYLSQFVLISPLTVVIGLGVLELQWACISAIQIDPKPAIILNFLIFAILFLGGRFTIVKLFRLSN